MHPYRFKSFARNFLGSVLTLPFIITSNLNAQTHWTQVEEINTKSQYEPKWQTINPTKTTSKDFFWEPLTPQEESLDPEKIIWSEPKENKGNKADTLNINTDENITKDKQHSDGLRWPNGQLMSASDQTYYRTAYSRGSMIQIGDTIYPNLGFNALQRHPKTYINAALVAIDDNRIGSPSCSTGNFFDSCADGLVEGRLNLWNSDLLSFDLHWTMHSLSGEGAPYNLEVGDETFGQTAGGTKFGEGQSLGFIFSKNFDKTLGFTFAGYRLFHLDEVTDLPRNFALFGTKVFLLDNSLTPPIVSLSLGVMTDVYNVNTNLGSITYPEFLRGGEFRSLPAELYGRPGRGNYYNNVAGVSSAFVCADQTVFAKYSGKKFKTFEEADPNCIEQVYFGPIASIGFAPWPWLGFYAKYGGTEIDLGLSVKPFKDFPWTISIEALNPIKGINPVLDDSFDAKECRGKINSTFSDCRTRIGIYTEVSF